jgi:hypothetical protein
MNFIRALGGRCTVKNVEFFSEYTVKTIAGEKTTGNKPAGKQTAGKNTKTR